MDMLQLETELEDSIAHYGKMLVLLARMSDTVGSAAEDELREMNATFAELHGQAMHRSQAIIDHLQKISERSESLETLLKKQGLVVREILLQNERVAVQAMAVKSLLAHEMATLRSGISVMKGYSRHENDQGRIVNRAS
jgi:hypothetical protein